MKEYNLYPPIEPFKKYQIKVDEIHEIYVEECGNPNGKAVIFLHGGPGAGCGKKARRFFDPNYFHIILFDQRGCGRSTPFAEIKNNTIFDSIKDMEKIREKIGIEKWILFGGSYGSTLALTYAINFPEKVEALILQGIFLATSEDIKWYFIEGISSIFPEEYDKFKNFIPEDERENILLAYQKRLFSEDLKIRNEAAKIWSRFEIRTMESEMPVDFSADAEKHDITLALIECHYFINNMHWNDNNYILNNVDKIKEIPTFIAHGRYDMNTRVRSAYELQKKLNNSELKIIEGVGHSLFTDKMVSILVEYLERIKDRK